MQNYLLDPTLVVGSCISILGKAFAWQRFHVFGKEPSRSSGRRGQVVIGWQGRSRFGLRRFVARRIVHTRHEIRRQGCTWLFTWRWWYFASIWFVAGNQSIGIPHVRGGRCKSIATIIAGGTCGGTLGITTHARVGRENGRLSALLLLSSLYRRFRGIKMHLLSQFIRHGRKRRRRNLL